MTEEEFRQQIDYRIGLVFEKYPERDHRKKFPWLTGSLGDPFSGIWFVAENPSLKRVESITKRLGKSITEESQWCVSRGDILFRQMLVKHGFKDSSWDSSGGWHCYITDIIKEADYVKFWRTKSSDALKKAGEIWWPVFKWELENSKPRLIVTMGGKVQEVIYHLITTFGFSLPRIEHIVHYSYIGSYAEGALGPMHPTRVQKYDESFAHIAKVYKALRQAEN